MEFYTEIKFVHIAAVLTSGGLFALRGLLFGLGQSWVMAAPVRYLVYAVDTVLLTAALMLATMLHQYPFADAWLTVKVLLLVVYIVLGILALRRGRSAGIRLASWLSALAIFGLIISVARAHDPLGALRALAPS